MRMNRILCPIDYSQFSKAANYYASVFAESGGGEIIYLSVVDAAGSDSQDEDRLDDLYTELSTKIRPLVHGLNFKYEVRHGHPAKEIVRLADEQHVDLIIMGTHGRTGASHMLHGSVCEKVLRNASCPVMAVKSDINFDWVLPSENRPDRVEVSSQDDSAQDRG